MTSGYRRARAGRAGIRTIGRHGPDGRPAATAAGSVAVTIGPPAPAELADVLLSAWCLSPRERQVAAALVSGQSGLIQANRIQYAGRRKSHPPAPSA